MGIDVGEAREDSHGMFCATVSVEVSMTLKLPGLVPSPLLTTNTAVLSVLATTNTGFSPSPIDCVIVDATAPKSGSNTDIELSPWLAT